MNQIDIAIVGGGIIGLSAAIELAASGRQVTVFDRSQSMHEASWAAAGMIAGHDPENPPALQPLADLSLKLYPEFLARVEALSGLRVPVRTTKMIQGAHELPAGHAALDKTCLPALAPDFVADPNLHFFAMDEISIDPRDLARALPVAARAAGVTILEDHEVTGIRHGAASAEVETHAGWSTANILLCAPGAWAEKLTGMPVTPRKGQMALVQEPEEKLRCVLRTPGFYLVPRGGGRIVIGATVEEAGFDKTNSQLIHELIEKAAALYPPARESRVIETWAGLRPASPDKLPMLGRCGERCFVAVGHFRNGIMLAPGTARVMRQLILGESSGETLSPSELAPYDCDRFASSSVQNR